jgi:hypothetical protein
MKRTLTILIIATSNFCFSQVGNEGIRKTSKFNVKNTQAIFLGKTKSVVELLKKGNVSINRINVNKEERNVPDNFKGRGVSKVIYPEKENQGLDPLRQMGDSAIYQIEPIVNVDGIGDFGSPHDPTGDVGLDHYVEAINVTEVGVFSKEGVLIEQFPMEILWNDLGASSAGDPIVLYDETAERWLITEFTDPANLLVAVSETSDPLGSYFAYTFSTPEFPDYPKYSIWPNAYLLTTNESGSGIHTQYFIDRQAMINGDASVTIQQVEVLGNNGTEQGFFVSTPVDWDGITLPNTLPMVLSLDDSSWGTAPEDAIRIISFDVDFDNPDNTIVTEISLVTTPYDSYPCSVSGFGFQCIPQQDGGGLDGIPEVIMNVPKYRNFGTHESMVCCFVTDVTNGDNLSGIRWMEMRKIGGGDWFVYQEGTFAPDDGYDRYMGSIAIDADGNIGLGYTVSSETLYAGLRFTGRYEGDPLGVMTVQEQEIIAGEGPINSGGRYGDYAQMSVDPVESSTFWFVSEYARSGGSGVGTRIAAFQLARDTIDLAVIQITSPVTSEFLSNNELLTIEVANYGLSTVVNYTLSFDFQGVLQETIAIPDTLYPEQSYMYTFSVPMDMALNGNYLISAHVVATDDSNENNNTLSLTVANQYTLDAQCNFELPAITCGTEINIPVAIINSGASEINTGTINVNLNGLLVQTIEWTGLIEPFTEVVQNIFIDNLLVSANVISIEFINPNGDTDELLSNNVSIGTANVPSNASAAQITIHTDDYPSETSIEVVDSEGNTLLNEDSFSSNDEDYIFDLCLSLDSCYTFTINDEYGDGICCGAGQGFYEITGANGNLIASGGDFGFLESVDFCSLLDVSIQEKNTNDVSMVVKPNPNDGFFIIELKGSSISAYMMRYQVINAEGKIIQDRTISKYNDTFVSRVSLLGEADGIYFIRFLDKNVHELLKVIKKS